MTISERLFELLKERGIMAKALAEQLDLSNSVISSWKLRNSSPATDYIIPICDYLKINPIWLLTGDEEYYNNGPTIQTLKSAKSLTENQEELLDTFNRFSDREQIKIIGIVENIYKSTNIFYN
jgi:transcriptional regulator with XRE-family HTH domain